jgi:3-phytase
MSYPYGLSVVGDGTAIVSEFGGSRVQRFDLSTGACVGVYGRGGRGPGEVLTPWGVAMHGGRLYILDSSNNRVQSMLLPAAAVIAPAGAAPKREGGRG